MALTTLAACGSTATSTPLPATEPPAQEPPAPMATPTDLPPAETAQPETAQRPTAALAPTEVPILTPTLWPTRLPPPATPPTATLGPRPTSTPPPTPGPATFVPFPEEQLALLAMLPERTNGYLFANIETIMQRPAFQESLEYALDDFVGANEKAPSEALLRSSAITALAFGSARGDESSEWYCVMRGDFTLIQ